MSDELKEIKTKLVALLKEHSKFMEISADTEVKFEVNGNAPGMQGKKKVDAVYFATVMPKAKDVRFYFYPNYSHKDRLGELPENVEKCLKGKSCFYIKKWDDDLENNLRSVITKAVELYKEDGFMK